MADKAKIKAALDTRFKGKSVSKNYKEALATKWAAKIENDEDIEAYLDDREDDILEASKEADARATTAAAKAKADAADSITGKTKTDAEIPKDEPLPDDTPAYVKAIMAKLEQVEGKVNGFETKQQTLSLFDKLKADERIKGIPDGTLRKYLPANDEGLEAAITELTTDFATVLASMKTANFGNDRPNALTAPTGGNGAANKPDPIADKAMKDFTAKKVEEFKQSQKTT